MCGRLACSLCPDDIPKHCCLYGRDGKQIDPQWVNDTELTYKPFYNGPPTATIPVIIYDAKKNNHNSEKYFLAAMKWGFSPSFITNQQVLAHTHNARVENVVTSNLYKGSLMSNGRCIVIAEGFYEWQTTPGPGNKQPYFIYQDPCESTTDEDKENGKYLMKMAGLWTSNIIENDIRQYSCAILTTESDKSFSWLHHRMPIILNTQEEIIDWLDHEKVPYSNILPRIKKAFSDRVEEKYKLKHYTVDKSYVNKTTCNERKCMEKVTVKRPRTLDNWLTSKKKKD